MARHLSRRLPLLRWQYLRWGLAIPTLPLALWACNSHPLKQPLPNPQMETDFPVLVSPDREVDILFMIDNSPSMDPKQNALAKNFPNLINVLQTIPDGSGGTSLPDVHIGVISSDMGAGSEGFGKLREGPGRPGPALGKRPQQYDRVGGAQCRSQHRSPGKPCPRPQLARWLWPAHGRALDFRYRGSSRKREADKKLRRRHQGRLLLPGLTRGDSWLRI